MGCDIHLQVERRVDGKWGRVPHPTRPCPEDDHEKCWLCEGTGFYTREFWNDRNYDVFAILADVRNGYGFAGTDTGDGFVPISTPKGFPDDLSDEIRAVHTGEVRMEYERNGQWYWMGDHSHSFLTVRELLDYDWDRTTKKRGMVTKDAARVFAASGVRPDSWCGWTNAPGYETIEWEVSYSDVAKRFLVVLKCDIVPLGAPEDVRLVFGFDS